MSNFLKKLRSQKGAALVEYALIASLIALPSVAAMEAISDTMNEEFNAIEDNAASAGHGTTTTAAPGSTTTSAPGSTTTTTTTTPTSTTTTTAAAPTTTTTGAPTPPAYQSESVTSASGTWTFEAVNGSISLDSYSKNSGWSGYYYYESDGDMVLKLEHWNGSRETVKAWLDDDGFLHISTW